MALHAKVSRWRFTPYGVEQSVQTCLAHLPLQVGRTTLASIEFNHITCEITTIKSTQLHKQNSNNSIDVDIIGLQLTAWVLNQHTVNVHKSSLAKPATIMYLFAVLRLNNVVAFVTSRLNCHREQSIITWSLQSGNCKCSTVYAIAYIQQSHNACCTRANTAKYSCCNYTVCHRAHAYRASFGE